MNLIFPGQPCSWRNYARVAVPKRPLDPALDLLRRLEWSGTEREDIRDADLVSYCPACREPQDLGLHARTCELGRLLGRPECLTATRVAV